MVYFETQGKFFEGTVVKEKEDGKKVLIQYYCPEKDKQCMITKRANALLSSIPKSIKE